MADTQAPAISIGHGLRRAIDELRAAIGQPHAAIAVIAPMHASAELARQALAETGGFIRIELETPGALIARIGRLGHPGAFDPTLRPEPPGWLEATLAAIVPMLAARGALAPYAATLCRPVWIPSLAEALSELEHAEIAPATLDALSDDPDLAAHARVLATLLREVHAARAAEHLLDPRAATARARALIATDTLPASARFDGYVVLGDGTLPRDLFLALSSLLARRPTRRLALHPLEHLAPAPFGLRLAAGDAPTIAVAPHARGALGHVQAQLYRAPPPATAPDDSLTLAATPDEVREIGEAIRVVQRHLQAGTPLSRIAIALPDNATAHVLEDALARAQIPATWLVGPPLSRSTPARFLALALALAADAPTVQTWYELVRHPGVIPAMRAHGNAIHGIARWRHLLSTCGATSGTARIVHALTVHPEVTAAPDDLPLLAARDSLIATLTAFESELDRLPVTARLAEHARALASLLERHQPPSPVRAQLLRFLRTWGTGEVGPPLTRAQLGHLLSAALESTQVLRGALTDRAIRVVPPMALVGAELDLVCVLGLTEGRFPAPAREHPLLPDRLVAALVGPGGEARLLAATERADLERRRFAAALGAATRCAWLSTPQSDLLEARPGVPSSLLLEVASARAGHRVSYRELADTLVVTGARDVFAPEDPAHAVSAAEHLLARLGRDPQAGLDALAAHPWARRLLRLYRAIDRFHHPRADAPPVLDAWSGLLDPTLPHPAHPDAPDVLPHLLAQALVQPTDYLFRRVIGAYRPSWLGGKNAPTDTWVLARWAKKAIDLTLADPERARTDLDGAFASALDAVIAQELRHRPGEAAEGAIAKALITADWARVRADVGRLVAARQVPLDGLPIADDLPWRLSGSSAHIHAHTVEAWTEEKQAAKKNPHKLAALELQALALTHAGTSISHAILRDVKGHQSTRKDWAQALPGEARAALVRIREARWPVAGTHFRLHREPLEDDDR